MTALSTRRYAADLDALRQQVLDLQTRVERLERTGCGAIDAYEAGVVVAIAAAFGARPVGSARILAERASDPRLADALAAVDVQSPRALGKLLARLETATIEGLHLHRVGVDREGVLWSVRVSPPPNSQG